MMKTTPLAIGALALALVVGLGAMALRTSDTPAPAPDTAASAGTADTAAPAATAPTGEVVLTITGGPDAAGAPIAAAFDLAALQALPVTKFETSTMWTEGVQQFEGLRLTDLLDHLNVTKGTLIATAINDYRIEIPIAEIDNNGPIIAYLRNGALMPVREKGPLWIVYPYDSNPNYQTEVVFSRSIWQLNRLEIAP